MIINIIKKMGSVANSVAGFGFGLLVGLLISPLLLPFFGLVGFFGWAFMLPSSKSVGLIASIGIGLLTAPLLLLIVPACAIVGTLSLVVYNAYYGSKKGITGSFKNLITNPFLAIVHFANDNFGSTAPPPAIPPAVAGMPGNANSPENIALAKKEAKKEIEERKRDCPDVRREEGQTAFMQRLMGSRQ